MTSKGKTDRPCDCGALEYFARDPRVPIEFDPDLREYNIVNDSGETRIHYCPFCGGKVPESLRSTQFAQVSLEEKRRLFALTEDLKTEADLVAALGPPDLDSPMGTLVLEPEADGRPPRASAYRVVRYKGLSDIADLCVDLHPDGRLASRWVLAKYVGPPQV
jgi:hypothetical protein